MGQITISVCDLCNDEQRSDTKARWDDLHAYCLYFVPLDGINRGELVDSEKGRKGGLTLCRDCRRLIDKAVGEIIKSIKKETTDGQ